MVINGDLMVFNGDLPSGEQTQLWKPWPIEKDGLPIKNSYFLQLCYITRGYMEKDDVPSKEF